MKRWPALLASLVALSAPALLAQDPGPPTDALKALPALPFKKELVGDFSGPGFKVTGFFSGTPVTVDEAFTTKYEHSPPDVPFMVTVPKGKDVRFLPGGNKTGAPELVCFATVTADNHAIEILRFATLSVPLQRDPADRLKVCAELLKTQGLAAATKGYEKVAFLDAYATKIGGSDAVCVHAHMTKPDTGEHYAVKVVGILHPKLPGGVMSVLMADTNLSEIKTPPDLASKGIGLTILHSLHFVDPPKAGAKP